MNKFGPRGFDSRRHIWSKSTQFANDTHVLTVAKKIEGVFWNSSRSFSIQDRVKARFVRAENDSSPLVQNAARKAEKMIVQVVISGSETPQDEHLKDAKKIESWRQNRKLG